MDILKRAGHGRPNKGKIIMKCLHQMFSLLASKLNKTNKDK